MHPGWLKMSTLGHDCLCRRHRRLFKNLQPSTLVVPVSHLLSTSIMSIPQPKFTTQDLQSALSHTIKHGPRASG